MKHMTYAEKSLMVGDEAADMLMEYAAELGRNRTSDTVIVRAITTTGDDVEATYLLGEGAPLMAESTHGRLPEPDNSAAIGYMKDRLRSLEKPGPIRAEDQRDIDLGADLDFG